MRRALALSLVLVIVTATPALAHVTVNPSEVTADDFTTLTYHESAGDHGEAATPSDGDRVTDASDDGEDGTDPVTFATLLAAGFALMALVAALVFARVRQPA